MTNTETIARALERLALLEASIGSALAKVERAKAEVAKHPEGSAARANEEAGLQAAKDLVIKVQQATADLRCDLVRAKTLLSHL